MNKNELIIRKKLILVFAIAGAIGMTTMSSAEPESNSNKLKITETVATSSNATPLNTPIATSSNAIIEKKDTFTGFRTDDIGTIYLENGDKLINTYLLLGEDLYHFDKDGYMTIGWFFDENAETWYYFGENGISEEGWIYDENNWYYLENGWYATGWKVIMSEEEIPYWFCFDETGKMYENCETPDGYYVNEDGVYIEENVEIKGYDDNSFGWNKDLNEELGQLSGLTISGEPAELFMLCIAGETSGLANVSAVKNGDKGCAYGACQLDYRYDLVGFMKFAYDKHPELWPAFADYINYRNGNPVLKGNSKIGEAFVAAMEVDYETAMSDQLEYMTMRYWDGFEDKMNAAGYKLDQRHIAVSAALFSINVNCGPQANVFINNLSPDMSDDEMIRKIYQLRNTVFAHQKVGSTFKGTTTRYKQSEPQMALDLLYGYTTIDSNVRYGGGVEWHGNPFIDAITTIELDGNISYIAEPETVTTSLEVATSSMAEEVLITEEMSVGEESIMETESETYGDDMIQLIDGTWIEKSKSGPGYEYMPTESESVAENEMESEIEAIETEETLPEETSEVIE